MINPPSYFDQSATTWDTDPHRIELAKVVGEAIRESHKERAVLGSLRRGVRESHPSFFKAFREFLLL